jgi:hypothetical protein
MMFISAEQLVAHAIGDYLLQSDWMAREKTSRSIAAFCHVLTYAVPFLWFRPSWAALAFISGTHFLIDRWRLARYVIWLKNQMAPRKDRFCWSVCSKTGYHEVVPNWLSVWLLIISDNILHVLSNAIALRYL